MTISQDDHYQLSRLVEQYCEGVIRHDVDIWSDSWADDGSVSGGNASWRLRGDPIDGKQAIVDYWVEAKKAFEYVVQTAPQTNFEVEPGSSTGTGRVIAQERFKRADGHLGTLLAIYHDDYVKTDKGWKFAGRRLEILDHT